MMRNQGSPALQAASIGHLARCWGKVGWPRSSYAMMGQG